MLFQIHRKHTLGKALGYYFWRIILRQNGKFRAGFDHYFWGPSHGLNEYNDLDQYKKTHTKPDKKYSMLPTIIQLAGDYANKVVTDLGCGTGFFSIPFANKAKKVYGLDNSKTQLEFAEKHENVEYHLKDIFTNELPTSDLVIATFVTNYSPTVPVLQYFFQRIFNSLSTGGKVILIVDLPNQKQLKKFGAIKKVLGTTKDEKRIQITLFNNEAKICDLYATYFTPKTLEQTLGKVGFENITWHKPIVSEEGLKTLGDDFWSGYTDDPELGYLTAKKPLN